MRIKYFTFVVIIGLLLPELSYSADLLYPVSLIPDSLKENANAVVRVDEGVYTVYSKLKSKMYTKYVITILNKNADSRANFYQYYDMYSKVNYIKGCVYDKSGKVVRKFKKTDITDQSTTGYSLFDDNRVQFIKHNSGNYPFTVEYESEIEYNGYINYNPWYFQSGYHLSVENSKYTLIIPENTIFKYRSYNFHDNVNIEKAEDNDIYLWSLSNLKALKSEPYHPRYEKITPHIKFTLDDFYYGGYDGGFKSWNTFGSWQNQLLNNKDNIPELTKNYIISLTDTIPDTIDKIKAVYDYLQSKTRYVSIQVGIGGFQPFSAQIVDEKGYGDCKALSNYMKSLLNVIEIPSCYTLIYSGSSPKQIEDDFPYIGVFNHAILSVPVNTDTLWLECTSQKLPFAYLHEDIADRKALIITDTGGKLINTPRSDEHNNLQKRCVIVNLSDIQNIEAQISTEYSGFQYEHVFGLNYKDPDAKKKWLYKDINIPSFVINKYQIEEIKDRHPKIRLNLDLKLNNYASIMGNRLFFALNLMNRWNSIPRDIDVRTTQIVANHGFYDVDSIVFKIPENYNIENIPGNKEIISEFGEYRSFISTNNNEIIYVRKLLFYKGTYEKEKYNDFRIFFKDIVNADNPKVVLINAE